MPKTIEDEAWWKLWVEDEGEIRQGVSAATRPAPTTGVGVLDRAVDVLDAVEGGARSFTSIAEETGLTKPTAHRMITALQAHGFLMFIGGVGYALGPRLLDSGLFNPAMLGQLVDEHQSGRRDHSAALWSLLMFEMFQRGLERPASPVAVLATSN